MNALVSIVIPAYNRASLVVQTLDSITAQTYPRWECILVDDGSTDDTVKAIDEYSAKDARIRLFRRPIERKKGANACRNIGLENAQGDYIIFFDSDDLMTPNHIEYKLEKIKESGADFVIARTKYFNGDNTQIDKYYGFSNNDISAINFVLKKVKWLTYDTCIKSEIAKKIRYNENLLSGQEFNYNLKLLLLTNNAQLYDEVVTLRRRHDSSIRSKIDHDANLVNQGTLNSHLYTYHDVRSSAPLSVRSALVKSCFDLIYSSSTQLLYNKGSMNRAVYYEFGITGLIWFFIATRFKASKVGRLKNWSYRFKEKLMNRAHALMLKL